MRNQKTTFNQSREMFGELRTMADEGDLPYGMWEKLDWLDIEFRKHGDQQKFVDGINSICSEYNFHI